MIRSVSGHGHVFHSAVGGGRRGQNAAVIGLFRGGGPGLAGTGGGRIAGRRIVVGLTIAVDRSSGDGILILLALGADYQFLPGDDGIFRSGSGVRRVGNPRFGGAVHECQCQAAGNADGSGARAGDGLGGEGVGGIQTLRNNLGVRPLRQGAQKGIRCRFARAGQGVEQGCLDVLSQSGEDEGLQLVHVDEIPEQIRSEGLQRLEEQRLQIPQSLLMLTLQVGDDGADAAGRRCGSGAGGAGHVGSGALAGAGLGSAGDGNRAGDLVGHLAQCSGSQGSQPVEHIGEEHILQNVDSGLAQLLFKIVVKGQQLGFDIRGEEALQARIGQQGLGELSHQCAGQVADEVAQSADNAPGGGVQVGNGVLDALGNGLLHQEVQDVDALVFLGRFRRQHLVVGTVVVHFCHQVDAVCRNAGLSDDRPVDEVHNVDGNGHAHADLRTHGAGIGDHGGIGVVVGSDFQAVIQFNGDLPVNHGLVDIFLNVQVKAGGNLHRFAVICLCGGAVAAHGLNLVAAQAPVAGVGQIGSAANGPVGLCIRCAGCWG